MNVYQFDVAELEDTADVVKVAVLTALVRQSVITSEFADEWAARHCVKVSKKNIWRTLTKRWTNEPEANGLVFTVVGFK